MADDEEGLVGLQSLHQDLEDLDRGHHMRNIDSLWARLETRVKEFRQLLDKPSKNEDSRKTVLSGTIAIDEQEYSVNPEFQENTIQLADTLDLDEIQSAKILLDTQDDAEFLEMSTVASALMLFHQRRHFLLECLRLLLRQSTNLEREDGSQESSRGLISDILGTKDGVARNGSLYTQKCMDAMAGIEKWLQALGERHQGALALGQTLTDDYTQVTQFSYQSLGRQHESLGAIINHLIKADRTGVEDFHKLLAYLPKIDRWNNSAIHYVPVIMGFAAKFGSPEGGGVLREARMLNSKILDSKDSTPWTLRNFQAATITWWLAEYSGWYVEQPTGSPVQNVNLQEEAQIRSDAFFRALRDGAFESTLSICSQITPDEWYDPAKQALIQLLLRDSLPLAQDMASTSSYFQNLLMEQFETFTDAFITNMPDTLRRFKKEEDDQRKRFRTNLQQGASSAIPEQIFHLERFLVIISFAFDHRGDAAQAFWTDVDSNLYGFLQWASKRQSTPCVSAFCEMLRSISEGEEGAASAHRFLLEEGSPVPAKIRRSHSLSWSQVFGELNVYTVKIREQPTALRPIIQYRGRPGPDEIDEPESSIMLESYLRLVSHLCRESAEVRWWILSQSQFPILEILFYLCSSGVPSSLQACAFAVVQALLTQKTAELSIAVWSSLDQWICGALSPPPNVSRPAKVNPAVRTEQITFDSLAENFEKANEFIALLHSLVSPAVRDTGLNDRLPFPETLGSTYRMSGIEPYIDFVFDKVFASKTIELEDGLQERILTWNVLRFAAVSLNTFNEDLVILANKSSISVDEAMDTSSLLTYVRLHPFARVMEWMFNERVLAALFASAHRDADEVAKAPSFSPLIQSTLCCVEVMNLIVDLQSTYLDIVRPLIKLQSTGRKQPVSNPALASFEDSVSLNMHLIIDLGLYSGVGNQDLTVASLKLLGKLAGSKKLNVQSTPGLGTRLHCNRLISVVDQSGDLAPIARSLTLAMHFEPRELSLGSEAAGWAIKSGILDFLIQCMAASPDRPTLAHAFLGFACTATTVDVANDGSFAGGNSLFHTVLHLATDYPDGDEFSMQRWSLDLKQKSVQILSMLWISPLTSIFTLSEMRLRDTLFLLFTRQTLIGPNTPFDGRPFTHPDFMSTASAVSLEQLLWLRCSLLEYTSIEIRLVATEGAPSLKERILSTLFGSTITPDGEEVRNVTIFDLLDFTELDISNAADHPRFNYFQQKDFESAMEAGSQNTKGLSDTRLIREIIILRLNELRKSGRFQDPNEQQRAEEEAQSILRYCDSENNRVKLTSVRLQTMKAWADMLTLTVGTCDLESGAKAALILQALQLLMPKLEDFALTNIREAKEVAKLTLALLSQLDFGSSTLDRSRAGDVANDRLTQVFRTALRAVNCPDVDMQLREVLYNICCLYLSSETMASDASTSHRHSLQVLKSTGEKLLDNICDDAYGASGTGRISALLLLDSLASLASNDKSNYIVETLAKTNFIQVLVETIEKIPQELRETNAKDIPLLLSFYETKLALLVTISQSRVGAVHVMNAGLFQAVRVSGLFSVDPDIGVEIDNAEALAKYYRLLLSIARVITSMVISRGPQNEQTLESAKGFLVESRPLVVAVLKRQAKIGGVSFDDVGADVDIDELVELFILLIAMTEFLNYEEQRDTQRSRKMGIFT